MVRNDDTHATVSLDKSDMRKIAIWLFAQGGLVATGALAFYSSTKSDIAVLKSELNYHKEARNELQADMKGLRQDVNSLRSTLSHLRRGAATTATTPTEADPG